MESMKDTITKQELQDALQENNKVIVDELSGRIDAQGKELTGRIDAQGRDILGVIEQFMYQVDERFNKIEKDIQDIKESIDRLINTLDGFAKRLEDMETENAARDAQYTRLLQWAEKVSRKTGIAMPQL